MAVTLKQIAELAGVSRGTVDRALYNRGRVKPEVAERIRKIADDLGYQPNRAGKALAMTHRPMKLGVIAQATETPFMHLLRSGIDDAAREVSTMGCEVLIREGIGLDVDVQLQLIDELLAEDISGLAICPADDPRIKKKINALVDAGIPVVTFNADIDDTKRMCFVGQNSELAGRTCAGLVNAITNDGGLVLPISGYHYNHSHALRIHGFCDEIKKSFPNLRTLPAVYCQDDEITTQELTEQTLRRHPDLKVVAAVYLSTQDPHAVSGAVSANLADRIFWKHAPAKRTLETMAVSDQESFGTDGRGMDAVLDATEELVRQKIAELMAGNIEAAPCDAEACMYCPVLGCEKRLG